MILALDASTIVNMNVSINTGIAARADKLQSLFLWLLEIPKSKSYAAELGATPSGPELSMLRAVHLTQRDDER